MSQQRCKVLSSLLRCSLDGYPSAGGLASTVWVARDGYDGTTMYVGGSQVELHQVLLIMRPPTSSLITGEHHSRLVQGRPVRPPEECSVRPHLLPHRWLASGFFLLEVDNFPGIIFVDMFFFRMTINIIKNKVGNILNMDK